jgi:uncharacterized RDD family membrane protein YckC
MTNEFEVTDELLATQGQRFLNYLIDFVVQLVIGLIIGILIIIIGSLLGFVGLEEKFDNTNRFEDYIIGAIISLIYFIPFESITSRSIGKFITGTIVVMEDGSKPDSSVILKRTLYRLLPFNALTFLGTPSRGWHDSKSDTYVVNKKEFEAKFELHNSFEDIGKDLI